MLCAMGLGVSVILCVARLLSFSDWQDYIYSLWEKTFCHSVCDKSNSTPLILCTQTDVLCGPAAVSPGDADAPLAMEGYLFKRTSNAFRQWVRSVLLRPHLSVHASVQMLITTCILVCTCTHTHAYACTLSIHRCMCSHSFFLADACIQSFCKNYSLKMHQVVFFMFLTYSLASNVLFSAP